WFPTLAELCKVPLPDRKIDGQSLVKIIKSSTAASLHDIFFWQSGGGDSPQWAVRQGDWKLIHNPIGDKAPEAGNEKKIYLFNIKNDVGEKVNESKQHPEIVSLLTQKYQEWVEEVEKQ
ncbi:MAG: sulfatase, partial [Bacteroidota bacterium]